MSTNLLKYPPLLTDSLIHVIYYLLFQSIILWLFSIYYKDVSLIDRFWGISFFFISSISLLHSERSILNLLVFSLVTIWSFRLSYHISKRNWGKGEDPRYTAIREGKKKFIVSSYFIVFFLQHSLLLLVSLPLLTFFSNSNIEFSILTFLGLLSFSIGLFFEIKADSELKTFKQNNQLKGNVLDTGVWSLCRHPNYFGDAVVWIGFTIMCFSFQYWYLIISPVVMISLLRFFTGVGPLEEKMLKEKPDYKKYTESVPCFWPNIFKKYISH